ncbi:DUF2459 domain-containing protein [Qipengyuania sp.]|uniref:DUF2459 domain-containing protein n=1 Tax=Qipengyuania sp. TaxID=2004515 RepID=UPI0035C7C9A5
MASPTRRALKRLGRWFGIVTGAVLTLVAAFCLAAWIGSSIARNDDWREPDEGIEILVGDNGVHTELVMPILTEVKDWRAEFSEHDLAAPPQGYTHVGVSWGERKVFLNTPTWADLTPSTAFGALFGGKALLHAAHYVRPAPGPDYRPIRLTRAQYARLVRSVERYIVPPRSRRSYPGYFGFDAFYDAPGRYTWRMTCNQWTSDRLADAGIRTGLWTPLAGGVMKWVPRPD